MDVYVASQSVHKVGATESVCTGIFGNNDLKVTGIKARSGINEQPMGNEETLLGATNRLEDMKQIISGTRYDLLIAFESGIYSVPTGSKHAWFDGCWTIVEDAAGNQIISQSAGLEIDENDVLEAIKRGVDNHTVGSIAAERTGGDGTDPIIHASSNLLSRMDILSQSLTLGIGQLLKKSAVLREQLQRPIKQDR